MDMDHGDEEELPMQIGDSVSILSFPMKRRMDAGHDFFREGDIECSLVRRDMECTKEEIDQLLDIVLVTPLLFTPSWEVLEMGVCNEETLEKVVY